jgi:putative membrane-bound dehydrogenase-like protein
MLLRRRFAPVVLALVACGALCVAAYLRFADPSTRAADAPGKPASVKLHSIPDVWKSPPGGLYTDGKGYAWFRCLVKVPEDWRGQKLELFSEPIDDAREAYVNGVKVGAAGAFPPDYRSGLGGPDRFTVREELVKFGQWNTVAVRVYDDGGRRNFNVAAPVLFGASSSAAGAIRLSGKWQYRPGDDAAWAKWEGDAPADASATFSKIEGASEVERTLRKLADDAGPLSPAESLKTFKVPDDLALDLVLADPVIGQPLHISFDERGRMWLVEYLQYPHPAGLKAVSRDQFLRTVYDKVPPPPPSHFRGADRVTIHEDTDGDGVYDKHKTFAGGLNIATSVARSRGGVWVLNPPYLLFYPDRNNDDVPDGDPEVHLEGFGLEDSHSVASNLTLGPDGWLYGAQGSTVTGNIKRPGDKEKDIVHSMGQLIWRYHPETKSYEIFAEGGGNAQGLEIDSKGRIYSGHNGGDTRGFHYVQGGYYQKGFAKHGSLSNPYAFGYFPHIAHHPVQRFTHAFVIYEGAALPKKYHGNLFGVGPLQSHVVLADVQPAGSTFKTKDIGHPITTTDTWVRPVNIAVGPDGGIYVADFYEQRIDHASHYQGRVHKESGRVYRLRARAAKPSAKQDTIPWAKFDYGKLSTRELLDVLKHPNKTHRQIALRLVGDRKDASAIPAIREMLANSTGQLALEALWALNLSGGLTGDVALAMLDHADPYVRLWTVRLLCDQKQVPGESAARLAALALSERNVEVRSQLACSARRLAAAQSLPIVRGLLARDEDAADPHAPLLLWWAIEAKAESDRDAVVAMFSEAALWDKVLVREHVLERLIRRYAAAATRKDLLTCARLLGLSPGPEHTRRLMAGFEKAFEGRSLAPLPAELTAALAKAGGGSLALQVRLGDGPAVAKALAIVADEKAKPQERAAFVQIFGEIREPRCVAVLLGIATKSRDDSLRAAALGSLQAYNDPSIPAAIIPLHNTLSADVQEAAQALLASRPAWALALLKAIDAGTADKKLVPPTIVRKLLFHNDKDIAALVGKHFGVVQGSTTAEMRQEIDRYAQVIAGAAGNPYSGKKLYAANCGKCHTLFGEGGRIGPELTAYKRDDLKTMLLNVVNPSAEIREGFENYLIYTADGRALNGFLVDQDSKVVVLRGVEGQTVSVERDNIDRMAPVPRSLMPEGVLKPLSAQEVRDLFAYLRATQPLP